MHVFSNLYIFIHTGSVYSQVYTPIQSRESSVDERAEYKMNWRVKWVEKKIIIIIKENRKTFSNVMYRVIQKWLSPSCVASNDLTLFSYLPFEYVHDHLTDDPIAMHSVNVTNLHTIFHVRSISEEIIKIGKIPSWGSHIHIMSRLIVQKNTHNFPNQNTYIKDKRIIHTALLDSTVFYSILNGNFGGLQSHLINYVLIFPWPSIHSILFFYFLLLW